MSIEIPYDYYSASMMCEHLLQVFAACSAHLIPLTLATARGSVGSTPPS